MTETNRRPRIQQFRSDIDATRYVQAGFHNCSERHAAVSAAAAGESTRRTAGKMKRHLRCRSMAYRLPPRARQLRRLCRRRRRTDRLWCFVCGRDECV